MPLNARRCAGAAAGKGRNTLRPFTMRVGARTGVLVSLPTPQKIILLVVHQFSPIRNIESPPQRVRGTELFRVIFNGEITEPKITTSTAFR